MTDRVPATDSSVSWPQHGYSYRTVLPAGREYVQLLRRRDGKGDEEPDELLLDVNELAGDADYVELGLWMVSPDTSLMAYSLDFDGDEVYELRFRDLATGADLEDVVPRTAPGGAWSADSAYYFYLVHDETWRQHQVWRHRIGTPATSDELVLEDPDGQFELELHTSRSGDLVVMWSANRDTSEVWVLDAADPTSVPRSAGGRRRGVEYYAEHVRHADGSDELLLVTNDDATEYRLARCPVPRSGDQDPSTWAPVRPEDPNERLEQVDAYVGHVVLTSRAGGRNQLRILPLDDLTGEGIVVRPVSDIASLVASEEKNVEHDVDSIIVVDESYLLPPVWSRLRPGHGGAHRAAPQGGAGLRLRVVRRRAAVVPVGRRHPGRRPRSCGTGRHATGRLGAGVMYVLWRLRVGLPRPGVGPGDPLAARPGRGLRARSRPRRGRGRPALVAGRPDGAQAAHLRRSHRGRRRPGLGGTRRRLADRHARPQCRRAARRVPCSPSARTAGARWSPRSRSST